MNRTTMQHDCSAFQEAVAGESRLYGQAIDSIEWYEDEHRWFAGAGMEYETPITFCPFCGERLPTNIVRDQQLTEERR